MTSIAVCLGLQFSNPVLTVMTASDSYSHAQPSANGDAGVVVDGPMDGSIAQTPISAGSTAMTILYLELVVNDVATGHIAPVEFRDGQFFLRMSDLAAVSLPAPQTSADRISTSLIEGLTTHYDGSAQQLHLRTPPEQRDLQNIRVGRVRESIPSQTSLGAVLNYDFYASRSPYGDSFLSYWTEMRSFGKWGSVSNTGISRYVLPGGGNAIGQRSSSPYLRFDTQWTLVDEKRMVVYGLGDTVTRSLSSGNSVRMAGFTFRRNFRLRPDVISYPVPTLSGTAAVPTSVDVLVNGTKMIRENLNAGPFTIQGIPTMNGAGTATVITRDALGRTVENTVSFYLANDLLKHGLMDFSMSVGMLRRHYGVRTASYGSLAGSGILRYGLTDAVTLNGQLELAGGLTQAGGGADLRIRTWGVLSSTASFSGRTGEAATGGRQGYRLSAAYRYNSRRFRIQARQAMRSHGYRDLATFQELNTQLASANFRRSTEVTGGVTLGRKAGTVSVGYFSFRNFLPPDTRVATLTYSRKLLPRTNLYLTANRSLVGRTDTTIQAQLVFSLHREGTMVAGVARDPDGDFRKRVQYTKTAPTNGGVGVSAAYSTSSETSRPDKAWKSADVTWRGRSVQVRGGLFGEGSQMTYWTGTTGSLIWMSSRVFAANRIEDAFAVVQTGKQSGIPVMFENQIVGRTGKSGRLLIPWVMSHYPGKFSIDPGSLPLHVEPATVEQRVVLRRKSGAVVQFPVNVVRALHLQVVDVDGTPLPVGAEVEHVPSGLRTAVGWDGIIYLAGVDGGGELRVRLPHGKTCAVKVSVEQAEDTPGVPTKEQCR